MTTMGERIKESRERAGLLQSELAAIIGVKSGAVISNWEKNYNKPDAEKIIKLCEALEVSASYLLDYYGGKTEITFSLREQAHIKKYRLLNAGGQNKADDQLDDLLLIGKYLRYIEVPQEMPKAAELAKNLYGGTVELTAQSSPTPQIDLPEETKQVHQEIHQKRIAQMLEEEESEEDAKLIAKGGDNATRPSHSTEELIDIYNDTQKKN